MKSLMIVLLLSLTACGQGGGFQVAPVDTGPAVGVPQEDGAVVHGRALVTVTSEQQYAAVKILKKLSPIQMAYAASSGSSTVTYTNAASTHFTIDATAFAAGAFTGDTLSLGNVSVASLSDNNLKVCGASNNQKCTKAVIRVYTTGSIAGFVNTADSYGAPVYAGALNPTSALGLTSAGSVQVASYTIPNNDNKVTLTDIPTTSYDVTSDFANAGAGSYSMTFVVEYVLLP